MNIYRIMNMKKKFTFLLLCFSCYLFGDYQPQNILVTGGCGFIGSNFINLVGEGYNIVCLDRMDYCARKEHIQVPCKLYLGDINNFDLVNHILSDNQIDTVVHFAAQSHVDNSFGNSVTFTMDNVLGTHNLIEACRKYGQIKRFIHISTDEVYGEVSMSETSSETSLLNPTNPYAASKAGAEFIVRSYMYSYNFPAIVTRGNNVYGPNQYPEKLIPKFILLLLADKKCTIQGEGNSRRNFIHASDTIQALKTILLKGEIGETYNIGTHNEYSVNDIYAILMKKLKPNESLDDWRVFTQDRNFNDQRYFVDASKLRKLGWEEEVNFDEGLDQTIEWYKQNYKLYDGAL